MALVTKDFSINITPGEMPPTVHVSEYDIGRAYNVTLIGENGSAFEIPTGTTATVEGTLNGAVGFTTSATISNNRITFALTESMTAYSGKAWCKVKLVQNSQPIQTCAFILAVDRAGVEAETVIGAPGFEEQIAEAAGAWLEDQGFTSPTIGVTEITGGHRVTVTDYQGSESFDVMDGEDTGVEVDTTLSVEGMAADAAAVGNILIKDINSTDLWESGYYAVANGSKNTSAKYIRTKAALSSDVQSIGAGSDYYVELLAFQGASYVGSWNGTSWTTAETKFEQIPVYRVAKAFPNYTFFANMLRKDNGNIAVSDSANVAITVSNVSVETDTTLAEDGIPADAKAVGDKFAELGLTRSMKSAILDCFAHVAWAGETDGENYYDALYAALFGEVDPLQDARNWLLNEATPYPCIGLVYPGAHESKDSRLFFNNLLSLEQGQKYWLVCNPAYSFFTLQCANDGTIITGVPATGLVTDIILPTDQYTKYGVVVKTPATAVSNDVELAALKLLTPKSLGNLTWDLNRSILTTATGQSFNSIQGEVDARILLTSLIPVTPGKKYRVSSKYPFIMPRVSNVGIYLGCANNSTIATNTVMTYTAVDADAYLSVILKTPSTATSANIADADLTVFEY